MSSFIFLLNEKNMPKITGSTCPRSVAHWSFCLWLHLVPCTHILIIALGLCFIATLGHAFMIFYFSLVKLGQILSCCHFILNLSHILLSLCYSTFKLTTIENQLLIRARTMEDFSPLFCAWHQWKFSTESQSVWTRGEDQWLRGAVVLKWMPFAGSSAARAGGIALGKRWILLEVGPKWGSDRGGGQSLHVLEFFLT